MAEIEESAKGKAAVPVLSLMMSVVAAVVVATGVLGGAGWWLVRSGHLPVVQGASQGAAKPEVTKADPAKSRLVALEPLLVNLADSGGKSYLRVAMTLREEVPAVKNEKAKEPEKGKVENPDEAAMRDAALDVLGRQTSASLLAADGKQRLKDELRDVLVKRVPEAKVKDVLFTEFLVQQ